MPRRIALVLRRALRKNPEERWGDAREFRHALWRTRVVRYLQRAAMLAIGGIVVGAAAVITVASVRPPTARPGKISVALPAFDYAGPPAQRAVADSLVDLLRLELRSHPDFQVTTSREALLGWPFRSPAFAPRLLNENAPHRFGGGGEEVPAPRPLRTPSTLSSQYLDLNIP